MIDNVKSGEVRKLRIERERTADSLLTSGIDRRLGELADAYRFEGASIDCENGADRDEVLGMLSSPGCSSVKEYLYGS